MKVLNLDAFSAVQERKLRLAGVNHEILEMTVGNFIETTRVAQEIANNSTALDHVEASVSMILRSVPTASSNDLNKLPLKTLTGIIAFIRGDGDDLDGVEESGDAEKK